MGDRALVIFTDGKAASPTVYLHWHGSKVPELLQKLAECMQGREGDLWYACARFIGICHEAIEGNLSLGVWNTDTLLVQVVPSFDASGKHDDFLASKSHGDAGLVVGNVYDFNWRATGGYLAEKQLETAVAV